MIGFAGGTHLASTMQTATYIKGLATTTNFENFNACDLLFIAQDVDCDEDIGRCEKLCHQVLGAVKPACCIVLVSQVPIGFTARTFGERRHVYYQVDTLRMKDALSRAVYPEQFIIGAAANESLPASYLKYLMAFDVPIVRTTWEGAELCKSAINYMLAAQIACVKVLSSLVSAEEWAQVAKGLHGDKRIGPFAYLEPGVIGGHLPRDVRRILERTNDDFTRALEKLCLK